MQKIEHERYKICSRLLAGETPTQIAESYEDISYSTVLRYKRELEASQENNTVAEYLNLEEAVLTEMVELIQKNTPKDLKTDVSNVANNLIGNKNILEALSNDLLTTAAVLSKRIRAQAMSTEHVSEIESLAEALCKLQNAFFNKSTTQVNVQNNYDTTGNHRYGNWLGDAPESSE